MAKSIQEKREQLLHSFKRIKWPYILHLLFLIIFILSLISTIRHVSLLSILFMVLSIIASLFLFCKQYYLCAFSFVLAFGIYIRTLNWPLLQNKIPLELDPFLFLRYAKEISAKGYLYAIDPLRSYPLGFNTRTETIFLSYVIVYIHKFINLFTSITIEQAALIYPVIFFALAMVAFYFLIKSLFDQKTALLASLFLIIVPAFLYRTMAGFADKEPLALFFMFLAFYFYIKAMKSNKYFALLSGTCTGFMGLSWGGFKFAVLAIIMFNIVLLILNKIHKKELLIYALWVVPLFVMLSFLTERYGHFKGLLMSANTGIALFVLVMLIINLLVDRYARQIRFPSPLKTILLVFIVILITLLILPKGYVGEGILKIKNQLSNPLGGERVAVTVAENQQPYFSEWWSNFGMYLILFFLGALFLFYSIVQSLKYKKALLISFALMTLFLVLSRKSPSSLLNGTNLLSKILFFGFIIAFAAIFLVIYLHAYYKDKPFYNSLSHLNNYFIFALVWFILTVLAARSGIRLFVILSPATAFAAAYLVTALIKFAPGLKDRFYRISVYVLIVFLVVPSLYGFSTATLTQAKYTGPSFNVQWQYAMNWVDQNIPQDAVFAHWWDYGYWIQGSTNRATILDGGNFIGYWNHLMARHVLVARTENEALEFLFAHNATHLLIISDEIDKYSAYSSIGSDSEFDVFSWIGTYVMDIDSVEKKENETIYTFLGSAALDEDFVYESKVFPAKETVIAGFFVPIENDESEKSVIKQPSAILFYRGERADVPVECIYDEKKILFEKPGLKGCLRIFPRYLNLQYQQENGALLYVSERGLDALWTKLFLFNEKSDYFELVYDDGDVNALAYYRGRILGPLKIWKINYPTGFNISQELKDKYLAITTPEWEELRKRSAWAE